MSSRPQKASIFAAIGDETNGNTKIALTIAPGLYDNSRRSATPPTSDKILYRRVCLKKLHTSMQCLYVKASGDFLQKQKESLKKFDVAAKSLPLYYSR